jgi:MFS family permease
VYAVNWYTIGAVLPAIGRTLAAGPVQLGIVLGAFLVGVGIFQVPAGFASIRYGARRVSLAGIAVLGASSVLCAFAPSWQILAGLRFLGGVGAAFFFSPALSLIASYFPAGQRGPIIGLYNGGFSIGGAVGLFGGAYVGGLVGWPGALAVGGVALLAMAGIAALILPIAPQEGAGGSVAELWRRGRDVLASRSIWALSLALTGFWGAIYVVAQYFVTYGDEIHPEWGLAIAALAAVVVIVSFPGGPVGGWLAERGGDRRRLAAVFAAVAGALVLAIPFVSFVPLVVLMVTLGFFDGVVFAILYIIPTYLPESRGEGLALGVGVVNSIQVILGSALAIAFGFVVSVAGFTAAWEFAGATSIAFLPLLVLVRPISSTPRGTVAGSPG